MIPSRDVREPDARFVAYFDMLGIASLTLDRPDMAWDALSKLALERARIRGYGLLDKDSGEELSGRLYDLTFSDTIIIMSRGDDDLDLSAIVVTSLELFVAALAASIPVRGAIAHGRFLFNLEHSLFSGPPLVRAYQLAEAAQWLGVIVEPVVAARSREIPLECGDVPVTLEWEVPQKGGPAVTQNVFDWPRTHRRNFKAGPPISVEDFYQAFEQLFGPLEALPPEVKRKYDNTTAFVNSRLST